MLIRLSLRHFVIVKSLDLDIESGFTVLTGETGAGKSILLDAIGLLLGERADASLVAQGADKTDISAEFDLSDEVCTWLKQQELNADDMDIVLIRRTIDTQGKSRAFINGVAVTLTQLRELGERLVHIHGQHAHQLLLKPASQRDLLDNHAQLGEQRAAVREAYQHWQSAQKLRMQAEQDVAHVGERIDALQWQLDGLNTLAPQVDEWETLAAEHSRLAHATTLIQGSSAAAHALIEDDRALTDQVREQMNAVTSLARLDERLNEVVELLDSALIQLQEAGHSLNHYTQRADLDESRWDEIDRRMSAWHEQTRKLHVEPEQLHAHWQELQSQLAQLQHGMDLDALKLAEQKAYGVFEQNALKLRQARQKAAKQLAKVVTASMQTLNMTGGQFDIAITDASPSAQGMDAIEFQVAGHAGVPLQALHKVASGGELARISLALSVITSAANPVPTLIFDEVDSGIGGAVAEVVGRLLAQIGQNRQVLCVTHLPQVAAQGAHHWRVSKTTSNGVTHSTIDVLDEVQRIDEIARMLGGVTITMATREHAQEMLSNRLKP